MTFGSTDIKEPSRKLKTRCLPWHEALSMLTTEGADSARPIHWNANWVRFHEDQFVVAIEDSPFWADYRLVPSDIRPWFVRRE